MMKTRILLIDDDKRILETFSRTLKLAGYTVLTAQDGEKGLAVYHQEQPDMIILDLRMPGMDGLTILQAIRQHDPEANVILATGHGDKDAVIEALRAGASDFLAKPIDQVSLESALRRAEERMALKRKLRASQEALRQQNERLEDMVKARTAELEREIEERKQAHLALQESKELFEKTFNSQRDAIFILDNQTPATIIDCNPATTRIFGYTRDEMIGRTTTFLHIDEVTLHQFQDRLFTAIAEQGYLHLPEFQMKRKDGTLFYTAHSVMSLEDEQHQCIGWVSVVRDISPRKQAEEQLHFQAHLLDAVEQAVIVTDLEGHVVYWNPFAEQLYGWSAEEAIGRTTIEIIASEESRQYATEIMACLQRGESWSGEYLSRRRDGTTFPADITCTPIHNAQGELTHIIGISVNITEQQQAQKEIARSEARLKAILNNTQQSFILIDPSYTIQAFNQTTAKEAQLVYGKRMEPGQSIFDFVFPSDTDSFTQHFQQALRGEPVTVEKSTPNGHWFSHTYSPIQSDDGEVTGICFNSIDITENKQAQAALSRSEKRYRIVSELVSDYAYAFRVDPDGTLVGEWVTEAFYHITGYTPDELPTGEGWAKIFHPEDMPSIQDHIADIVNGSPSELDYRIITKRGEVRWLRTRDRPEWDAEAGRVTRIYGAVQDITSQKLAEEALQESLAKYRVLFDAFPLGVTIADRAGKILEVNQVSERLLGIPLEEHQRRDIDSEEWRIIRPDGSPMPAEEYASVQALRENRLVSNSEAGIVKPNGDITWINITAAPLMDDRVVIAYNDITQRKQAEKALRESEERYRALIQTIQAGVVVHKADSQIAMCNIKAQELLGLTKDQMMSKKAVDAIWQFLREDGTPMPPDEYPVNQVLNTGRPLRNLVIGGILARENENENDVMWAMANADPTFDAAGNIDEVIVSFMEITERKQMEEALRESERLLAVELEAITRLQKIGMLSLGQENFQEVLDAIIDAATAIMGTDMGNIQLLDPVSGDLVIRAQCGFDASWMDFWNRTYTGKGSCHIALERGERIIVKDVTTSPLFVGTPALDVQVKAGVRAIQSTPLRTRSGTILGIFSTHFRKPGRPDDRLLQLADLLTRQIADMLERLQAKEALRQYTERLRIQHEIDAAILAAQSPKEIAQATLFRLYDLIPCRYISITEIDPASQRGRDLIVLLDEELHAKDSDWHPFSVAPRMIATIQEGNAHLVEDIAALETKSLLEERLDAVGIRSYVNVPLLVQDVPRGSLNLASETPSFFQPDHVQILKEIANSLAVALQQTRLLEQTQEDAQAKAMLLSEVNHRVMNNLTSIMAILDMEMRRPLNDENDLRAVLDDVAHRIGGMTTVHRMLSSAQWQPLDIKDVIERVIHAALSGSPIHHNIEIVIDAPDEPLRVPSKQAISLALVINELTTNSVKYAFQDRSQGRIEVEVTRLDAETVQVIFCDDGPGMPEAVLTGEQRDMGLWLVETNVHHNLNGEIDCRNDDGAVVTFTLELVPLA